MAWYDGGWLDRTVHATFRTAWEALQTMLHRHDLDPPQDGDPPSWKHNDLRAMLRLAGPVIAAVGLVFTAIGLISFFSAFGGGGGPGLFWCAFIGLPMTAIGIGIVKFAYLGAVSRYMANEVSPVAKDVVNYMAGGTKDSVRELAAAAAEGWRSSESDSDDSDNDESEQVKVRCMNCRALNDEAAKFCNQCGAQI